MILPEVPGMHIVDLYPFLINVRLQSMVRSVLWIPGYQQLESRASQGRDTLSSATSKHQPQSCMYALYMYMHVHVGYAGSVVL